MITSYDKAAAITKSDTVPNVFSAIYVGGAGDVTVTTQNGDLVTFKAPPVGTIIPVSTSLVMAATTATLLIGLNG